MTLARWLVVGALAGFGFLWAGATMAHAQEEEPVLVQEGDNEGSIDQGGDLQSGDTGAGSQITGIVSEEGTSTTVQATQTSEDSRSRSGDVSGTNRVERLEVGPRTSGTDRGAVAVHQDGDNEAEVSQQITAVSGDAIAGSQVTGIVATGDSTVDVLLDNATEDAEADSGNVETTNTVESLQSGPAVLIGDATFLPVQQQAEDTQTGEPGQPIAPLQAVVPAQAGPAQISPGAPVFQEGDNEAQVEQTAGGTTGDAIAGSQVSGLVASELGAISVNNRQSSDEPTAETGTATSDNTLGVAGVGPRFEAGDVTGGEVDLEQFGDNELDATQDAQALTGDGVAGSQVTGVVSAGAVSIVLDATSQDAEATSGDATATNLAGWRIDDNGEIDPDEAVGSLHVGPRILIDDFVGGGTLSVTQDGDNELDFTQAAAASADAGAEGGLIVPGDAVAGSQVIGVVAGAAADVAIDATLNSDSDTAETGDATATNTAAVVIEPAGDDACAECDSAFASVFAGPLLSSGSALTGGSATVTQEGDNEVDFSQAGTAFAGDAVAGSQVAGVVSNGAVAIVLDATSEDAQAESGDATADNTAAVIEDLNPAADGSVCEDCEGPAATVYAGPVFAVGSGIAGGDALVTQEGDNELDFAQSGTAGTGDAVAGGQVTGVVAGTGADIAIDATLNAEDDTAETGEATVTNAAAELENATSIEEANVCDTCDSAAGSIFAGPLMSANNDLEGGAPTVDQEGDNELDFGQAGTATSGDAVAGGQITGVVGTGTVTVVLDNTSEDADAESGAAEVANEAARLVNSTADRASDTCDNCESIVGSVFAGPAMTAGDDLDGSGSVQQVGDNELDFSQSGTATTGDAVAGGQVNGVVSTGGSVAIDATNTSEDAQAESGESNAGNTAAVIDNATSATEEATPEACDDCDSVTASVFAGPVMTSEEDIVDAATVTQTGDNELDFAQSGTAASGDAVAGGQVNGVVAQPGADVAIVASNNSDGDEATSGSADATNTAATVRNTGAEDLCDDCESIAASVFAGPVMTAGTGDIDATATVDQEGDNELDFGQAGTATSGDAVAGGQVTGVVSAGAVAIVLDNTSEDAQADSGEASADNTAAVLELVAGEDDEDLCEDCESIAASIFAGPVMTAGDEIEFQADAATVTQTGDNELDFSQSGTAASGDAVAGGQVNGVVALAGAAVAIDATLASEDASGESGEASVDNTAAVIRGAGDENACDDCESIAASIFAGPAMTAGSDVDDSATVTQTGDNELDFSQSGSAASGDAVAGAQVNGVVGAGAVAIVLNAASEDANAESGEASADNIAASLFALGEEDACVDCESIAASIFAGPVMTAGDDIEEEATVSQTGDNELDFSQSGSAISGDAVAGGQVNGVVTEAGAVVAIDATLASDGDSADTGSASVENTAAVIRGGAEEACDDCESIAASIFAGPVMAAEDDIEDNADDAAVTQTGDNELDFAQSGTAASGDAVAGGQVNGVVGAGTVAILLNATSEDAEAESGAASVDNSAAVIDAGADEACSNCESIAASIFAGPAMTAGDEIEDGGTVDQTGDNELDFSQSGTSASGDAVAGGQVSGVVADSGAVVAIDATLASDGDSADTGEATVANTAAVIRSGGEEACDNCESIAASIFAGPLMAAGDDVDDDATVTQTGDNELDFSQSGSAISGDAVAGGQVSGVVGGGTVAIVLNATSEDADAESGNASVDNTAALIEAGADEACDDCHSIAGSIFAGPVMTAGDDDIDEEATVTQTGDNELDFSQSGTAASGDAVAGGQVNGAVTETGAVVAIDATLASDGAEANTGDASVANTAAVIRSAADEACNDCDSIAGSVFAGPVLTVGEEDLDADATVSQTGDNELDFTQSGNAASGDAVAGGQVNGVVGGGTVAIVLNATSEDAEAESGNASVDNTAALIEAGAEEACDDCDSIAGSIFAGPVMSAEGEIDFEADDAAVTQTGDNELDFTQSGNAASGDAVAGGQVNGVVAQAGAAVAIDATLASDGDSADTGTATVDNTAAAVLGGAEDACDDCSAPAGSIFAGPVMTAADDIDFSATITQTGDNEIDFTQSGSAASGDAVAGGQVNGVVASGGSVAIVLDLVSEDSTATSGTASVDNTAAVVADGDCDFPDECEAPAGAIFAGPLMSSDVDIDGEAAITQTGDNELDFSQSGSATTGDAVAGGQVTGVVASDGADVSIDASNTAEDADADTGAATVTNEAALGDEYIAVGPVLVSIDDNDLTGQTITQTGDNELDVAQGGTVGTGDAVAGGQVTGVVAAGIVDVVLDQISEGDQATVGSSTLIDDIGIVRIGPFFEVV